MYNYVTLFIYELYQTSQKTTPYTLTNLCYHFDKVQKHYKIIEEEGGRCAKVRVRNDIVPYLEAILESDNFIIKN